MLILLIVVALIFDVCDGNFSPHLSDYDAYGLKISGNEIMLVEALCDSEVFLIRFSPYNSTSQSLQCSVQYNDSSHYVYSVGIGEKQNVNESYFYYGGEMITNNVINRRGAFIGILVNKDRQNAQIYEDTQTLFNCNYFEYESIEYISNYDHQEYFVFSVEPFGQYAIGLTKDYGFIYKPFSSEKIRIKKSNVIWSDKTTFIPISSDTDVNYTIVAGFILNGPSFRVRAIPTVYVLSNTDLRVLSKWSYTAALNSWQSHLTYSDLKTWSNKYVMSVNINGEDSSEMLIGMPFINIVFLLIVNKDGSGLREHSYVDNGNVKGFGKSVTWLSQSRFAILISNSPTNHLSTIYFYSSLNNRSLSSITPIVFPNIQQSLPKTIDGHLIRMISTPTSLVILNINSEILLILSSSEGYFSLTSSSISDSIVSVSQSMICMGGTFKNDDGIFPCSLCPIGTNNKGDKPSIYCTNCSLNSFCPIGSITNIDQSDLNSYSQAFIHPRSPEVIIFDEILLQNMFSIGSNDHCLFTLPLFWVLFVIAIVLIIFILMIILKRCVRHPRGHRIRKHVKNIFRQTDLISEGEMWIGGLISFAIVVLLIFAYTFSARFYLSYPSDMDEKSSSSQCKQIIGNVKYESGLQSLSIPVQEEEQPMFDLLNNQRFNLQLDLINTIASCQSLSIEQIIGSSTVQLTSQCKYSNGIVSSFVELPHHKSILKWIINDIALIGAIRITLQGSKNNEILYRLKELHFSKTFYDHSNRTLAQLMTMNLELTKAINETEPLQGHQSKFSGIWYPTCVIDEDHMFVSSEEYTLSANLTSTQITMIITESSYYIKNRQLPIAKLREIIFHNLLFTVVCLEIFRLIILLWKLTFLPLFNFLLRHFHKTRQMLSTKLGIIDRQTIQDISTTTEDLNIVKFNYL